MVGQVEKRFKDGMIQATVWNNVSKNGNQFKTVSLVKNYKQNGEWKITNSFNSNDVEKAINVLKQVRDYLENSLPKGSTHVYKH